MNYKTNHKFLTFNINYQPLLAKQFFRSIAHQPWAMLLHSASRQHVDSRFDILVAEPVATLKTTGLNTTITHGNHVTVSEQDPFSLLQDCLTRWLPALEPVADIPFCGGALGYFGYDLGRRVETVPSLAEDDIPLADMAVGLYNWALIVDHQQEKAVLVGEQPEQAYRWLLAQQERASTPFFLNSDWQSNMTQDHYRQNISTIHHYLHSGDCYQINMTQRFSASYSGSEWEAYEKLEQSNQAPFSAFIRTDEAAILSLSPERFIELKGRSIQTKPIKGTRPRSTDSQLDKQYAEALANASKDQAENLMIVDLLRNDIGRVAKPGSVQVPSLFAIETFPAVHHLVSTVTATLDDPYAATDLLRAAFPGGSITGAPKVRAMEIIEELEPHRRKVYCGSIGYLSRCGNMDTSITIRTLIACDQKLYVWAGGGIVADSQWDDEYQETLDKLSRILPVLENK
ncbi:aminodeoxychorismate synthase component I [Vibrio sp. HA2012]|uniref:aminodeoxychorismate synthase component 1 n=1 Tax=Vibrio sp. HA2012 TaxID=1971595 RepID=UPI000C2C0F7E|nr:aminodeoxychorismate synthase component 1 [Vibrio sp. HA2012]PJC88011.1 aminodeoxychorismate synthase component I [Vibrio sp. HA2012]